MKRIGNIWKNVLTPENSIFSIKEGTKHKRNQKKVQSLLYTGDDKSRFRTIDEEKASAYSSALIEKLRNKTWAHRKPIYKRQFCRSHAVKGGKWRDIYIPSLDDHIIAHMVMNASKEVFTRGMHPHCCGSVPGRGIKHIYTYVSKWMKNDRQCRYFVKLDIRHFYDTIDKDILIQKLKRKIKDKDILWAFEQIINSAPVACPVGYYTSPWLSNLYLEEFDWFVEQQLYKERRGKRIKYVRHYLRYSDDILLIGTSKADLEKAVREIERYLSEKLKLQIKPTWEIKKIGKHETVNGKRRLVKNTYWCDIGGYKFCKDATAVRAGIFLKARRMARKILLKGYGTEKELRYINSIVGWARHADARRFIFDDIMPYVSIKRLRKEISYVDKKRKQQFRTAAGY